MSYDIPKRYAGSQRRQILRIIDRGIKRNTPAREIKSQLRAKGLGYRDTNIYHDIRRRQAEYRPIIGEDRKVIGQYRLAPDKRAKSLSWFDNVFERYRQERKLTSKQAEKVWNNARQQSYDKLSDEEIDEAEDIWELYDQMF